MGVGGVQMPSGKFGGGGERVGVEHRHAVIHVARGHAKHAAKLAAAEESESCAGEDHRDR